MSITKEDVKKKLERKLMETEARIENWKSVTRKHKKDGGDFANVWKNFEGVYEGYIYSNSVEITIYGSYPDYSISKDSTYINVTIDNLTADDIENAIKDRIEYLQQYKVELLDSLEVYNDLYDETMEELNNIKDHITEVAGNRTSLWYIMMEAIEKHYYSTPPRY